MKIRVLIGLLALSLTFSCQQKAEQKPAEETVEAAPAEAPLAADAVRLSNLTDQNWEKGVGTKLNMLLVDFSQEKFDLLQKGRELHLENGEIIQYFEIEKVGEYIQVKLLKSAIPMQAAAEFPNALTVK